MEKKKRHGYGVNINKDGRIYEGEFANNEKFGQGVEIYANGNLYLGEFQNGKKHGMGQFFWFNLSSKNPKADELVEYYDGEWWGGLPDGQGVHQKINGNIFLLSNRRPVHRQLQERTETRLRKGILLQQ